MFEQYLKEFASLTKAAIIARGQAEGVWSATESNTVALMKWNKTLLSRTLADKLTRRALRGY